MVDIAWEKYAKDIRSPDVAKAREALDAFVETREDQIKKDPKARQWEEDRKKEIAKNKPIWRKKVDQAAEEQRNKKWNALLQGGVFNANLTPAPGYVLIGVDEKEVVSDSGIIIASQVEEPNEGVVLEVGGTLIWDKLQTECPCKVGDNILFKRGAGLNLMLQDKQCKLIYFNDILGIFQ